MRLYLLLSTLLAGASAAVMPAAVAAQGYFPSDRQAGARVWIENDRDYFRNGDRLDVRFTLSDDAYVAIVHVDPVGNLDFLFPASPWDNEYVRGGRMHVLPGRGASQGWTVRGTSGIGYVYMIASRTPLDFGSFRGRSGSPWDWGYAGRAVRGDPFLAFDQIARLLVPRSPFGSYVEDYYGYYVGGIHRYPSYACSDRSDGYGWGWTPGYGSCGELDYFLRDYPYYYDTRRFRGDRRGYIGQYDRLDPRHGFKEDPEEPARGVTRGGARQDVRGTDSGRGSAAPVTRPETGVDRRDPAPVRPAARPAAEPRDRPAPQRQPPERAVPDRSGADPDAGARRPAGDDDSSSAPGRRPAIGRP
ncbi:MAG: DUF4384 domain-containing protein [Gemmatimonadota bacterium]